MARRRKFLAVTPIELIPEDIRQDVFHAFKGQRVTCQMCEKECVVDASIDLSKVDIFYCVECSSRAGLTVDEVVRALVEGLSISYMRFVTLMDVLKVEPGTRRYEALVRKLEEMGVSISHHPEGENRS